MTTDSGTVQRRARSAFTLQQFNNADVDTVGEILGACLDIVEWVAKVGQGRPYETVLSLRSAGSAASGRITWDQVAGALARHPRIGEKKAAVAGTETESTWSSTEQGGLVSTDGEALAAGNRAYEERFGYLFLICASGLSGGQILAKLHDRLTNDGETEKGVVIDELRKIADLRLANAVSP